MRTDLKCWYVVVNNMLLIIKIIVNNMFVPVVFFYGDNVTCNALNAVPVLLFGSVFLF